MANRMNLERMMERLSAGMEQSGTVRALYGQPIHSDGRTLVPVAKVSLAFGGGGGPAGARENPATSGDAEAGGGAGGAVRAIPVGVIEMTKKKTRYLPLGNRRRLGLVFALGFGAGVLATAWRLSA